MGEEQQTKKDSKSSIQIKKNGPQKRKEAEEAQRTEEWQAYNTSYEEKKEREELSARIVVLCVVEPVVTRFLYFRCENSEPQGTTNDSVRLPIQKEGRCVGWSSLLPTISISRVEIGKLEIFSN